MHLSKRVDLVMLFYGKKMVKMLNAISKVVFTFGQFARCPVLNETPALPGNVWLEFLCFWVLL